MKKMFSTICISSFMVLTACGGSQEMYKNTGPVQDGKVAIRFDTFWEFESFNGTMLSFYAYFLSTSPKPVEINIKSAKIYREKDKAEYDAGLIHINPLRLECDKENSLKFSTSLPTLTTVDNYKLVLKYDSKTLVYHFYDKVSAQVSYSGSASSKK